MAIRHIWRQRRPWWKFVTWRDKRCMVQWERQHPLSLLSAEAYLARCRHEYDHHDREAMRRWGISPTEAQALGMLSKD